jgi:hypothetical protein
VELVYYVYSTVYITYLSHYTNITWTLDNTNWADAFFLSSLPLLPPATKAAFDSCLSSLYTELTLYRGGGLAYPYKWRGFVGAKKKTRVGHLVLNPFCLPPPPPPPPITTITIPTHSNIQHSYKQIHVHKNYQCTCFFHMALILNGFEAGKSITWGIGRGGPS